MTLRPEDTPLSVVTDKEQRARRSLKIGIVNNMPEAASQSTAEQFVSVLHQAAPDGADLNLRFFCPADWRGIGSAADPASYPHESAQGLWTTVLDGLIVTGAEPQAAHIADEPCLDFLSRIVDWAEAAALPTLWSCLAAHAAIYRLDGIERRPRDTKLFGVFECEQVQHHPLLDGRPVRWIIPHSRVNEVSEAQLKARGYQILTRSSDVGADTFVKQACAPHTFLSGHPEYGQATLGAEYRRDVRRFLLGERASYPDMPAGYFPSDASREMAAFREAAVERRSLDMMAHFPTAVVSTMPWRDTAVGLFRNWLLDVSQQKVDRAKQLGGVVAAGPSATSPPSISPTFAPIPRHISPCKVQRGRQTF